MRNFFKSGWRDALGWSLVIAVIHEFVVRHWVKLEGSDPVQLLALAGLVANETWRRGFEKIKTGEKD